MSENLQQTGEAAALDTIRPGEFQEQVASETPDVIVPQGSNSEAAAVPPEPSAPEETTPEPSKPETAAAAVTTAARHEPSVKFNIPEEKVKLLPSPLISEYEERLVLLKETEATANMLDDEVAAAERLNQEALALLEKERVKLLQEITPLREETQKLINLNRRLAEELKKQEERYTAKEAKYNARVDAHMDQHSELVAKLRALNQKLSDTRKRFAKKS